MKKFNTDEFSNSFSKLIRDKWNYERFLNSLPIKN